MEKQFIRVRSIKDITITVLLASVGIILTALPIGDAANIAGFFILLAAAVLIAILKSAYKDIETNHKYIKRERYFQQAMHSAVITAISSDPNSVDLTEEDKGNALRLDIYYCKSSGKAYVQLFEYVPYAYQPSSKMYEYELTKVSNLIR